MRRPHAAPTRFGGSENELRTMLQGGAAAEPAVVLAANRDDAYELTLRDLEGLEGAQDPLRVSVRPAHRDGATSVQFNVVHGGSSATGRFALSVTAVYNARRDSRHAPRLSLPDDHYQNVRRIINARAGIGEACVFFSGSVPERQSQASIVTATRAIAAKLVELGIATERTLTVVHIRDRRSNLGTPMYGGSDVLVGTIGRITTPRSFTPPEEHRLSLRLLFVGGAWAVQKDEGTTTWEMPISGQPPQSIRMQTAHKDTHACVDVRTTDGRIQLLVVHQALVHAEPMLRAAISWDGLDVDKTMALMRQHVKNSREMVIFAFSDDASEHGRMLMRRVMRALYDLGITAQAQTDAHVVVVQGEWENLRMETTSLLSLVRDKRADWRQREIGNPVSRVTPVAKKPKLGDRGPVGLAPAGPLAELPKRPGPPCTVS